MFLHATPANLEFVVGYTEAHGEKGEIEPNEESEKIHIYI